MTIQPSDVISPTKKRRQSIADHFRGVDHSGQRKVSDSVQIFNSMAEMNEPQLVLNGTIAKDRQSTGNKIHKANLSMTLSVFEPSLNKVNDQTGFRQPPPAVAQI